MTKLRLHINLFKAAIVTGCFFVCSCENSMEEVRDLGRKKISQDVALNVESYMSQNAVVKAKLTSPIMTRTEIDTPLIEFPKSLHVTFYNDSIKPESYLFAKYGRYLERQGKVLLKDSVIVFNVKGDTLFTDELWWDRNQELFYTSKRVLIKQPYDQQFIGENGMEADQTFKKWTLFNGSGVRVVADSTLPSN